MVMILPAISNNTLATLLLYNFLSRTCGEWSSSSVANVGEDRAGEVDTILQTPALAVKLLLYLQK